MKQGTSLAARGPASDKPYFRKRHLLPIPPENTPIPQIENNRIAGFHPAMLRHQHSPALTVAPNGDVIAIYYTSSSETRPDIAQIASRLRFGADEWDMPSFFLDFADANDHAPMLTTDNGTLRLYLGIESARLGLPVPDDRLDRFGRDLERAAVPGVHDLDRRPLGAADHQRLPRPRQHDARRQRRGERGVGVVAEQG